jgi:hypothetical protein
MRRSIVLIFSLLLVFPAQTNDVIGFFQEERLKVKGENPSYSICEIAKELGRRWAEMAPEIKQRYQQVRLS